MKFRINADLFRAVSVAVSTDETRYYLNGVNVEQHPVKGVILTATDGHRLLCAHDENGETDGAYIVPAGKDLIRATKIGGPERRRTGGGLVMVADGGSVTFRNAYDEATVTLPVKPVDWTFPDWRRVLPAAPDQAAVASYNPAYVSDLADVCADLKAAGFEGVAFTMAAADPGSPALVNYGMAPIFGVLMPMRNCIPLAIPAWVRARPAEDAIPYGQTSAMAAASHATPSHAPAPAVRLLKGHDMPKSNPPRSFSFSRWRHGGWYVAEVRYPGGACGCVSNNYADKRWRIACDDRPGAHEITYASREAAAMAEWHLAEQERLAKEAAAVRAALVQMRAALRTMPGIDPFIHGDLATADTLAALALGADDACNMPDAVAG